MKTVVGDLFTLRADALCVPTNGIVRRDGRAVMGKGVALEAARRYPEIPYFLGTLQHLGHHTGIIHWPVRPGDPAVVSFPTKHDWREPSSLALIQRSAWELVELAREQAWQIVTLPAVGCGCGGLDWEHQVEPLLTTILDNRFLVVLQDPNRAGLRPRK